MAESNNVKIPRSLEIGEYIYSYKDKLINNFYSYRCKHRTICKITIKIELSEIKKYLENKKNNIIYTITSAEKNHVCKNNEVIESNDNKLNK